MWVHLEYVPNKKFLVLKAFLWQGSYAFSKERKPQRFPYYSRIFPYQQQSMGNNNNCRLKLTLKIDCMHFLLLLLSLFFFQSNWRVFLGFNTQNFQWDFKTKMFFQSIHRFLSSFWKYNFCEGIWDRKSNFMCKKYNTAKKCI